MNIARQLLRCAAGAFFMALIAPHFAVAQSTLQSRFGW